MSPHLSNEMDRDPRRPIAGNPAMRVGAVLVACFVVIGLSGCSGPITGLPVYPPGDSELPPGDPAYPTAVQIKYLGAGGVVMKRGADVLLAAPFFSNPSILRVAFGEIRSHPEQVNRFLSPKDTYLAGATAVLVGHAHYDHLMDMPYIKTTYLPQAKIYGSKTMKNILAGDRSLSATDVISIENENDIGTNVRPGKWWYPSPRVRFMALKSEHAPIIAHLKFFEGEDNEPLQEIPTRAPGWREGRTLAYLVDFLGVDGKTVEFRIHYQDAASTAPLGFPPPLDQLDDPRRVDVALVCMPGFNEIEDEIYPEKIIGRLQPRYVVAIHWENFFELLPADWHDLRTVPHEDAERFLARLRVVFPDEKRFTLPAPGAWMRFEP